MKLKQVLPTILILKVLCLGILVNLAIAQTNSVDLSEQDNFRVEADTAIIADHSIVNIVRFDLIEDEDILHAKETLHIAYGHTSHGSQITSGMSGLPAFKEANNGTAGLYDWNEGGTGGALDLDDYFVSGDLGNPDRITWSNRTRDYLDDPANADVNVVMWSWCGQADTTDENIDLYLSLMNELELDYPEVTFIYMTGHVTGSGLEGNLHQRNEQIRDFVTTNNKVLFDFADIESYDPDGNYYGDKYVTDGCCYDYDGDNVTEYTGDPETPLDGDRNWAQDWQANHTEGVDWYDCGSAHSEPLNANMKAYAAWWLWAKLSGWNETVVSPTPTPTPTDTNTNGSSTPSGSSFVFGASTTILAIVGTVSLGIIVIVRYRKK